MFEALVTLLKDKNLKLATAESCTGGLIAAGITEISGSSAVFDRGFVTYSNEAKIAMLGVNPKTLADFGAVSQQTAREMAEGAIKHSLADIAVSVTGIAGPSGGTPDKPVGLVYIGLAIKGKDTLISRQIFEGNRHAVRTATTGFVVNLIMNNIK